MDPTTDPQAYYEYLLQMQSSLEQQKRVYSALAMGAPINSPTRTAYLRQLSVIDSQLSNITPQIQQYTPPPASPTTFTDTRDQAAYDEEVTRQEALALQQNPVTPT